MTGNKKNVDNEESDTKENATQFNSKQIGDILNKAYVLQNLVLSMDTHSERALNIEYSD